MNIPADLRYTKEHEWVKLEGNFVTVGITDFAQQNLGDVVFCELPAIGTELAQFKSFGVVESVKAVSDLYAPVAGKVVAINQAVIDDPASLNRDPYGSAWLIKLELKDPKSIEALLDPKAYEALATH